jgi:hypothetical protein
MSDNKNENVRIDLTELKSASKKIFSEQVAQINSMIENNQGNFIVCYEMENKRLNILTGGNKFNLLVISASIFMTLYRKLVCEVGEQKAKAIVSPILAMLVTETGVNED